MPVFTKKMGRSSTEDTRLITVKHQSDKVLKSLVKTYGIYASNSGVNNGSYHHFFGRDTAITALLILESERLSHEKTFSPIALDGLLSMAEFQGKKDDKAIGEEFGKIPHEVNKDKKTILLHQKCMAKGHETPWYVDPKDGILKNWDSVDSTPLWLIVVSKYIDYGWELPVETKQQMADATVWILNNLNQNGGFLGWTPADQQSGRVYGGLKNQAWKDSGTAFMYDQGGEAKYPMHDVFSNAAAWAALRYSSALLKKFNPELAKEAGRVARRLKFAFNSNHGFKLPQINYYAEALDASMKKLTTPSLDVGMCLACDFRGSVIFNNFFVHGIVTRIISKEFTDELVGTRTYSNSILSYYPTDQYHRGPNTYWPFAALLTARGIEQQGYKVAASKMIKATLNGLSNFNTLVELYQNHDGNIKMWQHPTSSQTSTLNQAWTAAGAHFASNYLLKRNKRRRVLPVDLPYANQMRVVFPTIPVFYEGREFRIDKKLLKTFSNFKRYFS